GSYSKMRPVDNVNWAFSFVRLKMRSCLGLEMKNSASKDTEFFLCAYELEAKPSAGCAVISSL
ncbi:MAG: hypothetical protein V4639_11465, partial [Pseudomonadota bacterium]